MDAGISCRRHHRSSERAGTDPGRPDGYPDHPHPYRPYLRAAHPSESARTARFLPAPRTCRELQLPGGRASDRPGSWDCDSPITLGEIDHARPSPPPMTPPAPAASGWTPRAAAWVFSPTPATSPTRRWICCPAWTLAVLEANHDVESLCSGPYPYYLKQRILGVQGHLCNEDAAQLRRHAGGKRYASDIVLAHLSRDNNTPAMALNRRSRRAGTRAGLAPGTVRSAPGARVGPCSHRQKEGLYAEGDRSLRRKAEREILYWTPWRNTSSG